MWMSRNPWPHLSAPAFVPDKHLLPGVLWILPWVEPEEIHKGRHGRVHMDQQLQSLADHTDPEQGQRSPTKEEAQSLPQEEYNRNPVVAETVHRRHKSMTHRAIALAKSHCACEEPAYGGTDPGGGP